MSTQVCPEQSASDMHRASGLQPATRMRPIEIASRAICPPGRAVNSTSGGTLGATAWSHRASSQRPFNGLGPGAWGYSPPSSIPSPPWISSSLAVLPTGASTENSGIKRMKGVTASDTPTEPPSQKVLIAPW